MNDKHNYVPYVTTPSGVYRVQKVDSFGKLSFHCARLKKALRPHLSTYHKIKVHRVAHWSTQEAKLWVTSMYNCSCTNVIVLIISRIIYCSHSTIICNS
jgi:hypothetical protein